MSKTIYYQNFRQDRLSHATDEFNLGPMVQGDSHTFDHLDNHPEVSQDPGSNGKRISLLYPPRPIWKGVGKPPVFVQPVPSVGLFTSIPIDPTLSYTLEGTFSAALGRSGPKDVWAVAVAVRNGTAKVDSPLEKRIVATLLFQTEGGLQNARVNLPGQIPHPPPVKLIDADRLAALDPLKVVKIAPVEFKIQLKFKQSDGNATAKLIINGNQYVKSLQLAPENGATKFTVAGVSLAIDGFDYTPFQKGVVYPAELPKALVHCQEFRISTD